MIEDIFKNIIKNAYNFKDNEKICTICGEPIEDFNDNGIYEGEYCEDCFLEAEEDRLR